MLPVFIRRAIESAMNGSTSPETMEFRPDSHRPHRERPSVDLPVQPHQSLLEVLRDQAGLTGTKECCTEGECGACTVLLNGRAVTSCLVLAAEADGRDVTTIEGLAVDGRLDRVQQSFLASARSSAGSAFRA